MLTEQFKIGDVVVMKMDRETRGWSTEKFPPDGTVGKIIARDRITVYQDRVGYNAKNPGVFSRDSNSATIQWDIDCTDEPFAAIGECSLSHVKLQDEEEDKRRYADYCRRVPAEEMFDVIGEYAEKRREGDLPETKFWEQDSVTFAEGCRHWDSRKEAMDRGFTFRIQSIDYYINTKGDDGKEDGLGTRYTLRAYTKEGEPSFTTMVNEIDLELVERGNVYRHFNGEQVVFKDLKDEMAFALLLGRAHEVRNPLEGGLFKWTKDQILDAVRAGTVHGMRVSHGFFGIGPRLEAIVFEDLELGERVRQETLKGFGG